MAYNYLNDSLGGIVMEKTRKAFVVLAAAVTAGGAGGCGSNTNSPDDPKRADAAAAVDTKVLADAAQVPDTKREDLAADPSQPDVNEADASPPGGAADSSQRDVSGADATSPDSVVDVTAGEVTLPDGGATDTTELDGVADTFAVDVLVRTDATVVSPDASGALVMPAGTLYDVLTRDQFSY